MTFTTNVVIYTCKLRKGAKSLIKTLKQLRNDRKLSRFELAKKVGCSPSAIANWERGDSKPSADYIYGLAKSFNIPTDDIFLAIDTTNVVKK